MTRRARVPPRIRDEAYGFDIGGDEPFFERVDAALAFSGLRGPAGTPAFLRFPPDGLCFRARLRRPPSFRPACVRGHEARRGCASRMFG